MMSQKRSKPMKIGLFSVMMTIIMSMNMLLFAKQKFGSFSGEVVDIRTGVPVRNAVIIILPTERSDTSDEAGRFAFDSIPVGYYDLDIRAEGYQAYIVPSISIKSGFNKGIRLEIKVDDTILELDKMVVTSHRVMTKKSDQSNSVTRLSRDEILNSPGATQDLNKAIQILPSVAGELSPGWNTFLVRGGQGEENIFLIDGIEVYNLSHWGTEYGSGGAISYLHPDFIESLDFYAGGVPAKFPPRLSSVMDIYFRDGSKTDRNWQMDLNMAGVGLFCEGPVVPGKASYILNGRVSFLDIMEPLINAGGLPKYQNGQAKLVWDINAKNKLSLNFLAGHETIDIVEDDGTDHIMDEGIHTVGGLRWSYSNSRINNEFLLSGKYNEFTESGVLEDSITYWQWDTKHSVLQAKNDISLFLRDQDVASFGIVAEGKKQRDWIGNDPYYIYVDTAGDSAYKYFLHVPTETVYKPIDTIQGHYDTTILGYRFGGYGNYTLGFDRVKIQAGVRNDYYTINRKHGVSPRGAVSVDLKRGGEISLSSGLYYQFPGYVTRLVAYDDYLKLPLQRNAQAVLGYSKQLSDVVLFGSEAYYKYYDREPLYTIQIPDANYPNAGYREIEASPDRQGKKKAFGLELFIHKKRLDNFFYQLSYSLTSVKRKYKNSKWYDDDHNFRNNAKLIIGSNFHRSHRASLRLDVSEGNPYTPIDKTASMNSYDTRYDVTNGWNSERRDPRINLSFRYDITMYLKRTSITSYVEVANILNRKDIIVEYYSFGDVFPEGEIKKFLGRGIFPIGGMTINF